MEADDPLIFSVWLEYEQRSNAEQKGPIPEAKKVEAAWTVDSYDFRFPYTAREAKERLRVLWPTQTVGESSAPFTRFPKTSSIGTE